MEKKEAYYAWTFLRLGLGWIFRWSFLDKVFGLGFSTASDESWLLGNSPTSGFLEFGTRGPFSNFFQSLAGSVIVDWLFMIGLLLIGLCLILGIGVKIAGYSGSLLLFLMWLALLPPEHNPFIDDHILYILALLVMIKVNPKNWWGLGNWWAKKDFVKTHPSLK